MNWNLFDKINYLKIIRCYGIKFALYLTNPTHTMQFLIIYYYSGYSNSAAQYFLECLNSNE